MKRIILAGVLFTTLSLIAASLWFTDFFNRNTNIPSIREIAENTQNKDLPKLTIIAEELDVPWEIVFLYDDTLLVTERAGHIIHINPENGRQQRIHTISNVKEIGEGGLHGMTLHPNFQENNYMYCYYTYAGQGNSTQNRVARFIYSNNTFSN